MIMILWLFTAVFIAVTGVKDVNMNIKIRYEYDDHSAQPHLLDLQQNWGHIIL